MVASAKETEKEHSVVSLSGSIGGSIREDSNPPTQDTYPSQKSIELVPLPIVKEDDMYYDDENRETNPNQFMYRPQIHREATSEDYPSPPFREDRPVMRANYYSEDPPHHGRRPSGGHNRPVRD